MERSSISLSYYPGLSELLTLPVFRGSRSVREGFWRFAKIPPGYFIRFSGFQWVSSRGHAAPAVWHSSCLVISQSIQTCH